jgi:hypothetical protein
LIKCDEHPWGGCTDPLCLFDSMDGFHKKMESSFLNRFGALKPPAVPGRRQCCNSVHLVIGSIGDSPMTQPHALSRKRWARCRLAHA